MQIFHPITSTCLMLFAGFYFIFFNLRHCFIFSSYIVYVSKSITYSKLDNVSQRIAHFYEEMCLFIKVCFPCVSCFPLSVYVSVRVCVCWCRRGPLFLTPGFSLCPHLSGNSSPICSPASTSQSVTLFILVLFLFSWSVLPCASVCQVLLCSRVPEFPVYLPT